VKDLLRPLVGESHQNLLSLADVDLDPEQYQDQQCYQNDDKNT
jgi:hypothetical protein